MEILAKLGIDWKLLIAQVFNFLILLWILKRYAYTPIIDFLEERSKRIEKGLEDAQEATRRLTAIGEQEKVILTEAKVSASNMIKEADGMAKKNKEIMDAKAQEDAERLLELTKKELEVERSLMVSAAKSELIDIVIAATEKVLVEKLDSQKDQELIRTTLQKAIA